MNNIELTREQIEEMLVELNEVITAKVEYITPELAAEWMTRNISNRIISRTALNKYKRDLLRGEWKLNGETIKLDPDGNLIDGQTRCTAIIETGIGAFILVARGIKQNGTIDVGTSRSLANSFQIAYGDQSFDTLVGHDMNTIGITYFSIPRLSPPECKILYDFLGEQMNAIRELPYRTLTGSALRTAAAIAMKQYNVSLEVVARFMEVSRDGFAYDESENQAIAYKNAKEKGELNSKSNSQKIRTFKQSLASILVFNEGQPLKKLTKVPDGILEFNALTELLTIPDLSAEPSLSIVASQVFAMPQAAGR